MAHKKAAGSAKNLRDSKPKYRGVKVFGGQVVRQGSIIIRQKGDKYKLGRNTYKGRDYSIHSSIDGIVQFRKKRMARYDGRTYLRTVVEVVSPEESKETENKKTVTKATKSDTKTKNTTKTSSKTKSTEKKTTKDASKPKTKKTASAKNKEEK